MQQKQANGSFVLHVVTQQLWLKIPRTTLHLTLISMRPHPTACNVQLVSCAEYALLGLKAHSR